MLDTDTKIDQNLLQTLAHLAGLAPSAHNSQPWLFVIDGQSDQSITVKPNFSRWLDYSDPQKREFYLSLGTAGGNLLLAARGYGLGYAVEYLDKGPHGIWTKINFHTNDLLKAEPKIVEAIKTRHNNRFPFESIPLPPEFIAAITNMGRDGINVRVVEDQTKKLELQNVVAAATAEAFHDKKFTRELSSWMHPSLKKYRDGFVGYNLGIPWPMSFLFPSMLRHLPLAKPQTKMQVEMLEHAPAYAVITSVEDNPAAWLRAGRTFEEIAITAELNGIKIGVFGAPIETGNYYKQLQQVLQTNERPQMFFRLGYTHKVPEKSPRLEHHKIII